MLANPKPRDTQRLSSFVVIPRMFQGKNTKSFEMMIEDWTSNFDLVKCEFPLKCIVHLYTDYTVCFPTFHYQSLFLPICGTGLHAHLIRTCTDMYIRHCSDIQCVSSQFSASCLVSWFPIPVRNTFLQWSSE